MIMIQNVRVGIVTFHRAENYGAFLQVYALQNAVNSIVDGIVSEVIDYQPESIEKVYKVGLGGWYDKRYSIKTNCIRGLEHFYQLPLINKRKKKFNQCIALLKLSKRLTTTPEQYDVVILGSDQIWNPAATEGVIPYYYGKHSGYISKRTISYAASIGGMLFSKEQEITAGKLLSQLDAISIREKSHKQYVEKLSGNSVSVVIDPTFLVERSLWEQFAVEPLKGKYILYYSLENNKELFNMAKSLAKMRNLPLVVIALPPLFKPKCDVAIKYVYDVGPREFVGLIRNAECVFTNSFHATCFSIIFRKEFYTYLHSKTGSRMQDLLEELGLDTQMNPNDIKSEPADMSELYDTAYGRLESFRRKSFDYLSKNIREKEE